MGKWLRRIFWDWSTLTLGAGGSFAAFAWCMFQAEWFGAMGFLVGAAYAAMTFGEGLIGQHWERRARALDAQLCAVVGVAVVRHADGRSEPLATFLAAGGSAEGVAPQVESDKSREAI